MSTWNQFISINLWSSLDYYKRPSGVWGHVRRVIWVWVFFTWADAFWEGVGYMGYSGNRSCQRASRSVLKCFTKVALTISAGSLFQQRVWWKRFSDWKPSPRIPLCDRLPGATMYHSSPFTHLCFNLVKGAWNSRNTIYHDVCYFICSTNFLKLTSWSEESIKQHSHVKGKSKQQQASH